MEFTVVARERCTAPLTPMLGSLGRIVAATWLWWSDLHTQGRPCVDWGKSLCVCVFVCLFLSQESVSRYTPITPPPFLLFFHQTKGPAVCLRQENLWHRNNICVAFETSQLQIRGMSQYKKKSTTGMLYIPPSPGSPLSYVGFCCAGSLIGFLYKLFSARLHTYAHTICVYWVPESEGCISLTVPHNSALQSGRESSVWVCPFTSRSEQRGQAVITTEWGKL